MFSQETWLLILCVFGLLVALGSTSGVINERLWMSEPLACALAGVALGPLVVGLVHLDPAHRHFDAAILREGARFTLAVAVTGAAVRLPAHWLRRNWRTLAVALGPGMLLMWAAGALVTAAALRLPLMMCLLVGAAIAPTDPVLSAPILCGRLAERAVPAELRHAMTAESGINDGLGLPLVMVPILLMQHSPGRAGVDWLAHVVGWEIGGAILSGAAAGWLTAKGMAWTRHRSDADEASLLTVTIALALAVTAGVRLLGSDEILAAFVAGAVLSNSHRAADQEEQHERFSEALARFFDLPIMIVFGAVIPWSAWIGLGWRGAAFALGILLLRRIPAWLLLGRLMPATRSLRNAAFAGCFGPIGAAALFYAMHIQQQTGSAALWPAISLAVGASVLAHGASSTPLTHILGRRRRRTDGNVTGGGLP